MVLDLPYVALSSYEQRAFRSRLSGRATTLDPHKSGLAYFTDVGHYLVWVFV